MKNIHRTEPDEHEVMCRALRNSVTPQKDKQPMPTNRASSETLVEALERIADKPGPGIGYTKGVGEYPVSAEENCANIAQSALDAYREQRADSVDEAKCSTCGQTNSAFFCSDGFHAPWTAADSVDEVERLIERFRQRLALPNGFICPSVDEDIARLLDFAALANPSSGEPK